MGSEVAADVSVHTRSLMNYLTYIKNIYGSEISGPRIENSFKPGMNSSLKGHTHTHTHTQKQMWILMPSTSWTPSDNNKLILLQPRICVEVGPGDSPRHSGASSLSSCSTYTPSFLSIFSLQILVNVDILGAKVTP